MSGFYSFKDNQLENNLFLNRIVAAFIAILLLTSGLIIRLIHLQVTGHEHYASLAKDNSIKISPIVPTRGMIYERHGNILAENTPSYSLEIIPEKTTDIDDTLARLQQLLAISEEKIDLYQKQRKRQKRFTSTPLLLSMTDEEIAKFAVQRPFFPGVDIRQRLVRHYPYGELAAHVVGYVGRINEAEIKTLPSAEYQGSTHVAAMDRARASTELGKRVDRGRQGQGLAEAVIQSIGCSPGLWMFARILSGEHPDRSPHGDGLGLLDSFCCCLDQRRLVFIAACTSRAPSRSFSVARLSCCFLPLAKPISHLMMPPLKCRLIGTSV